MTKELEMIRKFCKAMSKDLASNGNERSWSEECGFSLEDVDFMRRLGIIRIQDDDLQEQYEGGEFHIHSIEVRHNFMCDYCTHFLDMERGFVLVPFSRIKEFRKKYEEYLKLKENEVKKEERG